MNEAYISNLFVICLFAVLFLTALFNNGAIPSIPYNNYYNIKTYALVAIDVYFSNQLMCARANP